MKQIKLLCLLLFLIPSCIKELNYRVDEVQKQLVVNSIIGCYQPVSVNVSGLQSILDTTQMFINNATVILEEEGGNTDTLSFQSNGNYSSYIYGKPGKI